MRDYSGMLILPSAAFRFRYSGLRLTQSIRSNFHAGTRILLELLTPDPVLSLSLERALAYFTVRWLNLSPNLEKFVIINLT